MASTRDIQKIRANIAIKAFDFDPDATSLTDVGWIDMLGFESFMATFVRTIGASAIVFKILANDKSDGSGTDVIVKTKTVSAEPDAVGDQIHLEVNAEEIREACDAAGVDGRYVSAQISLATATDEGVVIYTRFNAKRPAADLTADIVA
jgi:hypothetical protein